MDKKKQILFLLVILTSSRSINRQASQILSLKIKTPRSRSISLTNGKKDHQSCYIIKEEHIIFKSRYCFNKLKKKNEILIIKKRVHLVFTPSKKQKAKVLNNGLFIIISIPMRSWNEFKIFS